MKKVLQRLLLSPEFQGSLWAGPLRRLIRATGGTHRYSPQFLAAVGATARPHYAYCMLGAADLARRLGHPRISAIEFGVAGGNGLAYMCDFAREVERTTGIGIDCYGFDTGQGMPPPDGPKDLPYWFRASQYRMDEPALRAKVPAAKLVIGDIRDTVPSFVEALRPAPIGAIFNDTDYWSSTSDSFRLWDAAAAHPECFLPRAFLYFDDVIGTRTEMYGATNGQLAAIAEFNAGDHPAKLHLNQNLLGSWHLPWRLQIYYAHLFAHPEYDRYVGDAQQEGLERELKLR